VLDGRLVGKRVVVHQITHCFLGGLNPGLFFIFGLQSSEVPSDFGHNIGVLRVWLEAYFFVEFGLLFQPSAQNC
jgi:hypothetical protein